jgi:DNA polymerase III alpha subunit
MDMRAAEDIGLVKMDALGLKTLDVIQAACDMIGMDPKELYDLDWEDTKVYEEIFNKDRMTGIFQFEGNAVRSLMKGLGKVERFDDIAALTSLARPGPLIGGAAENWVKSRRGDLEPRDLHPSLESTFGVICYQEQMMHIMRDIGGFSEPQVQRRASRGRQERPGEAEGVSRRLREGCQRFFGSLKRMEKAARNCGTSWKSSAPMRLTWLMPWSTV